MIKYKYLAKDRALTESTCTRNDFHCPERIQTVNTSSVSLIRTSEKSTVGEHKLGSHFHGSTSSRDGTSIYLLSTIQAWQREPQASFWILSVREKRPFPSQLQVWMSQSPASNMVPAEAELAWRHLIAARSTQVRLLRAQQRPPTAGRLPWTWTHGMTEKKLHSVPLHLTKFKGGATAHLIPACPIPTWGAVP